MTRKPVILLADNDPDFLKVRRSFLEENGYKVYPASTLLEVRKLIEDNLIDVIVTDLRLTDDRDEKDTSGLLLAKEVDSLIPKIILTRYPTYKGVREALGPHMKGLPLAVDFIAKQEGPEALIAAVKRAIEHHFRINPSLQIDFVDGLSRNDLVQAILDDQRDQNNVISKRQVRDEIDFLLKKIFFDYSRIFISPFFAPDQSKRLLKVSQKYNPIIPMVNVCKSRTSESTENVIVKIGERYQIRKEWDIRLRDTPQEQRPSFDSFAEHHKLAAISYVPVASVPQNKGHIYWAAAQFQWEKAFLASHSHNDSLFERRVTHLVRYLTDSLGRQQLIPLGKKGNVWFTSIDSSDLFPEVELPDVLPLMFYKGNISESYHFDDIRHILEREIQPPSRMSLLFVFSDTASVRKINHSVQEKLCRPYACDVIVFGKEQLQTVLTSETPSRTLRSAVLAQIDLLQVSPFQEVGGTSDQIFFGREQELREVAQHARRSSYAVIGGRLIGKTSLLGRLHRVTLPAAGFRTIYYDCEKIVSYNDFLNARILEQQPDLLGNSPFTFNDLLENLPSDKSLVLLLDEADRIISSDKARNWRLLKTLRSLASTEGFQVVFSGERVLRAALQDPSSPLYNFPNPLILGPLDYRAVEELVTRPMRRLEIRLIDEAAIVRTIYDFTAGHPSIVQRLCRHLLKKLNERGMRQITLDEVRGVIDDPQFQETDFLQIYWERASPLEKIITLVTSQDMACYSLKQVRTLLASKAGIQPSVREVKDALDSLVDLRSIFKRSQAGYGFAIQGFSQVLKNATTVEDLIEVFVEEYKTGMAQA